MNDSQPFALFYGARWLVGETNGKWTVYEQGYRQKVRVVATADSESEAVTQLLSEF